LTKKPIINKPMKKLMFELEWADGKMIFQTKESLMDMISVECENIDETDDPLIITPILMTDEEFSKLPEYQ
jgi:hypothetical protein